MTIRSLFRSAGLSGALALGLSLAGCTAARDPAKEEPVELAPGEYHVTMAGRIGMLGGFEQNDGPGKVDDRICVSPRDAESFPTGLVRRYLGFGRDQDCSIDAKERQGNLIGGTYSCPTDPQRMPGGSIGVDYQGAIAADAVELQGRIRMNLPESSMANVDPAAADGLKRTAKMMEKVEFSLSAKRVGDCGG